MHLYLGTVPASELSDRASVVGLVLRHRLQRSHWQHATTYVLPANTLVHVTIYTSTAVRDAQPVHQLRPGTAERLHARRQADPDDRPRRRLARLRGPADRPVGADEGHPDDAKNPCDNAPCGAESITTRSSSRSARRATGSTAGSASCRARRATSMASAARCRPSATWTATSRSYERAEGRLSERRHFRNVVLRGCWRT